MEFGMNPDESINLLSAISGLAGVLFGIYNWFYNKKNKKKAMLYSLYLACYGIADVISNYEILGEERSRKKFISYAKSLDEIYDRGSIADLQDVEDRRTFLSMKKDIDENLEFIEQQNWFALKDKFSSKEFKQIENKARALISRCYEEDKSFKELSM
jgi:hypothetical protein